MTGGPSPPPGVRNSPAFYAESGMLLGVIGNQITTTPLAEVVANRKPLDLSLFELAKVLSR